MATYGECWNDYIEKTNIWHVQVCDSTPDSYLKWPRKVANRILLYINKDSDVVDIGCGTGDFCHMIAPNVRSVTGLDVSSKMIEYASKRPQASNLRCVLIKKAHIPIMSGTVDLVNSTLCFQHVSLDTFKKYLKESYRVLKNTGVLHFQIMAARVQRRIITDVDKLEHIYNNGYPLNQLRSLVVEAGFENPCINQEGRYLWVLAEKLI